jgi:7,8-dihydropterin-6-yl-methyl-4-(beta-D-ribofuranosyl)aminobenzene 5'-phosphate synthase
MLEKAKEKSGRDIHLAMGGFHLLKLRRGKLQAVIQQFRNLGVERVAPTHCSGDLSRAAFAESYGDNFILAGVGKRVEIR